jgi:hypothetical protein
VRWWQVPVTFCLVIASQALVAAEVQVSYSGTGGAETIRLRLRNCTNQGAAHRVFAGEVHPCTLPGNQPLVTGEDLSFELAPNEQRIVLVPVYCGNFFLSCPPDGTPFLKPSPPYPRLRQIILQGGDSFQIQELIWQETNRSRLPESGPPTFIELMHSRGRPSGGGNRSPAVMCLAGLPNAALEERSRTDVQRANVQAMGWIGLFLVVPVPLAAIFVLTWLIVPSHRPRGPRHA